MFQGHRIGALLLMGGEGQRFGGKIPKQFRLLGGKKVYLHALDTLKGMGIFDEIVLACHPEWLGHVSEARVVAGGSTRQESSYAGLKGFVQRPDIVLIHDAVRPFVSDKILLDNVRAAIAFGAVDTCIPSTDTLVYAPNGTTVEQIPQRSHFLRGQTPQTFRYHWILEAHAMATIADSSDDCRLALAMGRKIHIVLGSENNLKITSERDLQIAENLLARKQQLATLHL